jgi:flagellar FliL protein
MADEEQQEAPAKSGGKGLIIVLLVILILLIVGVGVMAFLLLSGDKGDEKGDKPSEEQHANASHGDEGTADAVVEVPKQFKKYDPPEPGAPPQYFAMEQFVVNFKGEGKARFLAVTLKFMTHYPQLVVDMENYKPILRNDITGLLRVQTYTEMSRDDGPDILRVKIMEKAKALLEKHGIFPDILEDVYFERFVMQ